MTDERINVAMAEACPEVIVRPTGHAGWNYKSSSHGRILPCINGNIFDDLNAMHEMEAVFGDEEKLLYVTHLTDHIDEETCDLDPSRAEWMMATATARQRAEAYLRTIGKWEEL